MKRLSILGAIRRSSNIRKTDPQTKVNSKALYECIDQKYSSNNAILIVENWNGLDLDPSVSFAQTLDVLEEAYEHGTDMDMTRISNVIAEQIIPKVRDAIQMQASLKRKGSSIKTKIATKINNKISDAEDLLNTNKAPTKPQQLQQDKKDETVKECLTRLEEAVSECLQYDRVLTNHTRLSKRFNIDEFVKEAVTTKETLQHCIVELCSFIDTYEMPFKVKYNVALENVLYAFAKNGIVCEKKDIANTVTDYFLLHSVNEDSVKNIKTVIKNTRFYSESDIEDVETLMSADLLNDEFDNKYNSSMELDSIDQMDTLTENAVSKVNNVIHESKLNKVKEIFNKFKLQPIKTPEAVKAVINKMLTQSAENIVEETPNILQWIFAFLVVGGALSINPILGLSSAIALGLTSQHVQRAETLKMIKIYKSHRDKANSKMKTTKNEEAKDRCKKYIDQLDKDITKLENYYDDLLSDTEKEAIRNKESEDDEYSFDEAFNIEAIDAAIDIVSIGKCVDKCSEWNKTDITNSIGANISKTSLSDIDTISEFSMAYPEFVSPKDMLEICESYLNELRRSSEKRRYDKIDCLNENINKLKQNIKNLTDPMYNLSQPANDYLLDNIDIVSQDKKIHPKKHKKAKTESASVYSEINDISICTNAIKESMRSIRDQSFVLEMDFSNTIALLIDRVKKTTVGLSDKEKVMSQTLDGSLEDLKNKMEDSVTNENREAVIKGSIIPSASKIVKLAISSGLAWMINPAIAVIGLIGSFALAKKIQARERQMILDELDVELVMVTKYITVAEEKKDMKSLRQLLMIQKKLEHQKSRLKYKMEIDWNQKTANTTADKD